MFNNFTTTITNSQYFAEFFLTIYGILITLVIILADKSKLTRVNIYNNIYFDRLMFDRLIGTIMSLLFMIATISIYKDCKWLGEMTIDPPTIEILNNNILIAKNFFWSIFRLLICLTASAFCFTMVWFWDVSGPEDLDIKFLIVCYFVCIGLMALCTLIYACVSFFI